MAGPYGEVSGALAGHRCAASGRPCLYEVAIREAIATQNDLDDTGRLSLSACDECGEPHLIQEVWQPLNEEGELACPRCGATVASWDGARSFVAYWLKPGGLPGTRRAEHGRRAGGAGAAR